MVCLHSRPMIRNQTNELPVQANELPGTRQFIILIYIKNCPSNELRLQFIRLVLESSRVSSKQKQDASRQTLWNFNGLPAFIQIKATAKKQDASHRTLWIPMGWLYSRQITPKWSTGCISINPMTSDGSVAFAPIKDYNNKLDASHQTLCVVLSWLVSRQIMPKRKTGCLSLSPMNP